MALGLATLSGCSDFLDQNNKSNVPSAEFYQTSAGFASLTNSAYSTLRELYNAQPQLFVAGTDLYADGKSQGVVMSQYTFTADEGIIKNFYVSCFKGIQLANSVISYGEHNGRFQCTTAICGRSTFYPCMVLFPTSATVRACSFEQTNV